ncbi:P-loop containing nucleoside triphosphate hydrolase protein [Lipomyces arxii]|uniref:P-loop containing nucleoside triphosphate hydrolase protein n=1 Tax=Lipomyces arxii TaxID=56418 RepID=UPI0034CECDC6
MSDSESEYDISNAIASFRETATAGSGSDSENEKDVKSSKVVKRSVKDVSGPPRLTNLRKLAEEESDDEDFFKNLANPSMVQSGALGKPKKTNPGKFNALGLSTRLVKQVHRKGYNTPTPIQRKAIPLVLDGLDVVGMARTGSGKTAAFVLPMIDKLQTHSAKVGARAIILAPSRELALQTLKVVKEFSKGTDLKSVLLVGGDSLEDQFSWMMANPDIIIATPGRFAHLQVEMSLDLRSVEYVVFDEADRLFELGFAMQLTSILASLPPTRQTLLFSATLPKSLVEFARAGLQDPVLVRLDADSKVSDELEMFFFSVKSSEVDGALVYLLQQVIKMPLASEMPKRSVQWQAEGSDDDSQGDEDEDEKKKKRQKKDFKRNKFFSKVPQGNELTSPHVTVVFTPTRHHVEYVTGLLRAFGFAVSYIYGSLDQHARRDQLAQFRSGVTSILVVTDVAARGIDIPILSNVINYAFPGSPKVFVHRVGRTARAGKRGRAFSLVKTSEVPYLLDLELFLGKSLVLPTLVTDEEAGSVDYTENIVVGSMPRDELERACEDVQNTLSQNYDLSAIRDVSIKAEKLYLKTRGSASNESANRSKEVVAHGWDTLNPYFRDHKLAERETMLDRLANFRPHETIFELSRKGGVSAESGADLMRRRRMQVAPIQQHAKQKFRPQANNDEPSAFADAEDDDDELEDGVDGDEDNTAEKVDDVDLEIASENEILGAFKEAPSKLNKRRRNDYDHQNGTKKPKFSTSKDSEHYISHYAPSEMAQDRGYGVNGGKSLSVTSFMDAAPSATFDLVADEQSRLATGVIGSNRTKLTKWDKKRGKYITKPTGDDATLGGKKGKMIRGENGVRLPATYKSGRFESWKKAHKKTHGPRVGEMENAVDAVTRIGAHDRRFKHTAVKAPKPADRLRDDYKQRSSRYKVAESKGLTKSGRAKNELRSSSDIRKNRKMAERRKEKNARPSKKHKK